MSLGVIEEVTMMDAKRQIVNKSPVHELCLESDELIKFYSFRQHNYGGDAT